MGPLKQSLVENISLQGVIAIFLGLQALWPYSLKKPDFGCSSGQVLSKTKSVTPHFFFYISDITNSSSFNGKISRKKSMLEKFGANVLKRTFVNRCLFKFVQMYSLLDFSNLYEGLFSTS